MVSAGLGVLDVYAGVRKENGVRVEKRMNWERGESKGMTTASPPPKKGKKRG